MATDIQHLPTPGRLASLGLKIDPPPHPVAMKERVMQHAPGGTINYYRVDVCTPDGDWYVQCRTFDGHFARRFARAFNREHAKSGSTASVVQMHLPGDARDIHNRF